MDTWTLAVDVGPSHLTGAVVGPETTEILEMAGGTLVPDADPDRTVEAVAGTLADLHRAAGGDAGALVVVTPGETTATRFAELAEAAALAGLPQPTWLPEVVARAGEAVSVHVPDGGAAVVVDARHRDVPAWGLRRRAGGVEVGAEGAVLLGPEVDALLVGVVRAKLGLVAPDLADTLDRAGDPRARRDVAHLRRELRRARRLLGEEESDGIVVTIGAAEVSLDGGEFAELVVHATRQGVARAGGAVGADTWTTIVVAEADGPLVQHVVGATGAVTVLDDDPRAALRGVRPLLLGAAHAVHPTSAATGDGSHHRDDVATAVPAPDDLPTSADRSAPDADESWGPHPDAPRPPSRTPDRATGAVRAQRRPRGAVPALATALVVAVVGAVGVLVLGPSPTTEVPPTPRPAAIVVPAAGPAPVLPVTAPVVPPTPVTPGPAMSGPVTSEPATTAEAPAAPRTASRRAAPRTTTTSPRTTRTPAAGASRRAADS